MVARGAVPSGVAAGHPATATAGIEILEAGGTAADAAVAASLASCVAETVMTGVLGGGHAVYWDGGEAWNLDCFVDVPTGRGADPVELQVPFGEELVHYAVGPGTCAVPGLSRGLGALHARFGGLPWARLVEPALRLAREGVVMPPAHAACLAMLGPVYTMQPEGERIYARGGRLLEAGDALEQPGLVAALELLADEGADSVYVGSIAARLAAFGGVAVSAADLARYESRWETPVGLGWLDRRLLTRAGRDSAGSRAARRARRPRGRGAYDEPRDRRPGRECVRAHVEPRPGYGRLPPRPRPAAEQHARRGRPRPRTAAPGGADGQHDGADTGPRPGTARARDRLGGRNAAAHSAGRGGGGGARRGSRSGRRGCTSSVPPVGRCRQRRAGRRRGRAGGAGRVGAAGPPLARSASLLRRPP